MADAQTLEAPLKKQRGEKSLEDQYMEKEFEPLKRYVFQLAEENPERELPVIDVSSRRALPHKKFRPFQNVVFTSQIIWKGQRRAIRYYDGCTTLFIEDQPKEKEVIDRFIAQTKKRNFLDGKLAIEGNERWLLLYLYICGWNAESPFRTKSANMVFVAMENIKIATRETERLDQTEKALELAKKATEQKMRIHAEYLGIPVKDEDSDNDLSEEEIRPLYRKEALSNSAEFIRSYGDKSIEIKIFIQKAIQTGQIIRPKGSNKVAWKTGNEIMDVSGVASISGVEEKLLEFSQLPEGEEFLIQLKAIYSE